MTSQPPPGANPFPPQSPYQPQGPYQPPSPYPAQNPYAAQSPQPAQSPYPPQSPYRAGPPQVNHPGPPYPSPYQNPANQPWSGEPGSQPPDNGTSHSPTPATEPAKRSHKGLIVAAIIAVVAAGGAVAFVQSNHKSTSTHTVSSPKPVTGIAAPKVSTDTATSAASVPTSAASTSSGSAAVTSPTTSAPPPVNGSNGSALPVEGDDWRLDSTSFVADSLGNFGGTAKFTYIGKGAPTTDATIFDITVLVNGKDVADVAAGPVGNLTGGQTTLDLVSEDPLVPGPYTYILQAGSL